MSSSFEEEDRSVDGASFELLLGPGRLDAPGLEHLYRLRARRFPLWMEPEEVAGRLPEGFDLPNAARLRAAFVSKDERRVIGIGLDRVLLLQLPPWPGYPVVRGAVLEAWTAYRAAVVPVEASRPILTCRFLVSSLGNEAHVLAGLRGLPRAPRLAADRREADAGIELASADGHHLTVSLVPGPPATAPRVLVRESLCPTHDDDLATALDAARRKVAWAVGLLAGRTPRPETEHERIPVSSR